MIERRERASTRYRVTETESHPRIEYRVAFSVLDAPLVSMTFHCATGCPQPHLCDIYRVMALSEPISTAVGVGRANPAAGGGARPDPMTPEDEPSQGETA